jgi:geranylgeranyl pyrophosphate synthase
MTTNGTRLILARVHTQAFAAEADQNVCVAAVLLEGICSPKAIDDMIDASEARRVVIKVKFDDTAAISAVTILAHCSVECANPTTHFGARMAKESFMRQVKIGNLCSTNAYLRQNRRT